jgi:uncharacterized protein YjdB
MKNSTFLKLGLLFLLITNIGHQLSGQKYDGLTALTSDGLTPTVIFDGNTGGSGWQDANNADDGWLIVDLGSTKTVSTIKIFWEAANALNYNMSFSTDGVNYSGQMDFTNLAAGNRIDLITLENTECRYLKFQGVTRQLPYGYYIYEFEVYPPVVPVLTSISVLPVNKVITAGEDLQFVAIGKDQLGMEINLTEPTIWSVVDQMGLIDDQGLFSSPLAGNFTVRATNSDITAEVTVEVLPLNPNIAVGKSSSASTGIASLAIDGNQNTRWESLSADPQWIIIDLETNHNISDMIVRWEGANAKNYIVESSLDGTDWSLVVQKEDMPNAARYDRMYDMSFKARYIRLTGIERNTIYGYSIWEWQIFGIEELVLANEITVTAENDEITIDAAGGQRQLFAEILPENTSNQAIMWSVNDETIATIDQNGLLTALMDGEATVTAKALDGSEVEGSIVITITNQPVLTASINLSDENDDPTISTPGGQHQLFAEILPANTTNKAIIWSVNDETIATIDQNGLLTALIDGEVTVTAKALDGSEVEGSIVITITNQPVLTASINITAENNDPTINTMGGERQLFAETLPANTTNQAIIWSVNDETIATIDQNGLLTAVSNGEVTVAAKALDGSEVEGSILITISNQQLMNITTDHLSGVSMFPNPAKEAVFIVSTKPVENIHITNISGKRVKTITSHNNGNAIDITHLLEGFYIVTVIDSNGQATVLKMVKE